MSDKPDAYYIAIEQLAVGVYVHLDLSWMEHDFPLNSFKIKKPEQITALKALGLKKIRIDPERSDFAPPLFEEVEIPVVTDQVESISAEEEEARRAEQERLEFIRQQRIALELCEKQFSKAASSLRSINANVHARPQEAFQKSAELVQDLLSSILSNKDVAIRLMSDKAAGEEMYYHALNVSVLAMMLAKELNTPPADIEQLGLGCLFHDIGKTQIPFRVLKNDKPTRAEINLIHQHSAYGEIVGQKVGLSQQALDIVMQHHERYDGGGYPKALAGDKIARLARIAAIVNVYDNHCNPPNPINAMTPYEALAHMYASERNWFDPNFLSVFIRSMGVYPPGTLVKLSDGVLGMVIATNFGMPLRPRILIYDPAVPKNEAIVLDLQSLPELSVLESIRPVDMAREVYQYLSPRSRMTYFFDVPVRSGIGR